VADHQQALLEITDTGERLRQELDLLDQTRRQLAARTVLQDTFRDRDDDDDDKRDADPGGARGDSR
jgi:ATP-dependent Lon protease